jgi:hypothetical protein
LYQENYQKIFLVLIINPAEKNRAKPEKQKGKKEWGWGEGIFALLRLELECFRFSLIKRKSKQKIFHIPLKEKNGGRKKYEASIYSALVRKCKIPLCSIFHFAHSFEYKKCNEKIYV